ncbi:DUF5677 domain-containing protein [Variovorax sp. HJSM1_2]|uniref:DUF5677 domain-containing protein n=1 Tax=Variovorax sp. HJSM1_2 TaxID=3366263 RepID=UPI003BC6B40D
MKAEEYEDSVDRGEVSELDPDYAVLLDYLFELVKARGRSSVPRNQRYKNDAQLIAIKLCNHLHSIRLLSEGARYLFDDGSETAIVDCSSVAVLVRGALETYLMFHYLFGSADEEVNRFRHACWGCCGLMTRQSYAANTKKTREQVEREKPELDAVRAVIKTHPEFQKYSAKQQAQLLQGNWDVKKEETSFLALAKSAGMDEKYFRDIYQYLSGFAHSSYEAVKQIQVALPDVNLQRRISHTVMEIATMVSAMLIEDLRRYFMIASDVKSNDRVEMILQLRNKTANRFLRERWGKNHPDGLG